MIGSAAKSVHMRVGSEDGGQRLDRLLTAKLEGLSRARVQSLIRDGAARIGERTIGDPGHRVKPGDEVSITIPETKPAEPRPQAIPLAVVYEDDQLIVIDKPAGLVVHPAAGHAEGTLVNALLAHCGASLSGIGGVARPGIVHRLDKDTSGLLVVAKTDLAHRHLAEQFQAKGRDGRLSRRYLALVWGVPERGTGRIEAPLARSSRDRTRITVARGGGRSAVTHYRVVEVFTGEDGAPAASLLELELETGRTHQIRVHLQHMGHPVMGDPIYGTGFRSSARRLSPAARAALDALPGQALHAAVLAFEHPVTGRRISLEAAPPAAFADLLQVLRASPPARALPGRRTAMRRK